MEESNTEDWMDCDTTNQSSIGSDKSEEYFKGFDLSNISDSHEKDKSCITANKFFETDEENICDSIDKLKPPDNDIKDKDQEFIDNLFDGDMGDFDSDDFMKGSPLGENLELDKIMEELKDTIEQDIFGSENNSRNDDDSLKENDPELENMLNNDIISYITSDDGTTMDNIKSVCDNIVVNKPKKKYKAAPQHLENENRVRQEHAIISLINKELEDTMQFTNYLCHYIYNDVIVGKDFYKLFSSKSVKTDTGIINAV